MGDRFDDLTATWRYQEDLPQGNTQITKAWKLLESYSGIEPDKIEAHVTAVVSTLLNSIRRIGQTNAS
jgi:hypothetical protein